MFLNTELVLRLVESNHLSKKRLDHAYNVNPKSVYCLKP